MKPAFLPFILIFMILSCDSEMGYEKKNIELVEQYYDAVNNGEYSSVESLVSENLTKINNGNMADKKGPELLIQAIREHIANNREYRFVVEDIFSARHNVAVRWRWESINIKTGKEMKVTSLGLSVLVIKNSKIDTLWQAFDLLDFNKQLGIN